MAGLVPAATVEQIRAASDIVDIISAYLPLKRAGANFVTLCPFHKEKTPSFHVNPHRQIFHCFGCHKGGDVFTFVEEYENVTFVEAVRRLAQRANIPLEFENTPGQQQARYLKETLLQIHEQITQRWQNALHNEAAGQAAREYLKKRAVPEDAAQLFRLGCAPEAWDDTVNWAKSKGHELSLLEQAGLVIRKPETGTYYDRFRGRLMFPIADEQARVIAFSGRVLAGDEKTAKYVNSPETPIFTKGKVFYGLDKSKRPILEAGFAVICEGQLDLIACYMAGVRNVVAPQGTAFTADHARILKRYVNEVVLCFDGDKAGQAAAIRVLDSLLASGMAIRVACVPGGHDPDSFIKAAGGDAFMQLINKAEGFFDFYLNHLAAVHDLGTDKGRLATVQAMAEALHKTGNAVIMDTYAQKTAQRLGVSVESLRVEFKKLSRQSGSRVAEDSGAPPEPRARPPGPELWLLEALLVHDELVEWIGANLDLNWLQDPLVRELATARLAAHASGQWQGLAAFLDHFKDPAARSLITEVVTDPRLPADAEGWLKGSGSKRGPLEKLRNEFIDRQLPLLNQRLSHPEVTSAEVTEIHRQLIELRQMRQRSLSAPAGERGDRRASGA